MRTVTRRQSGLAPRLLTARRGSAAALVVALVTASLTGCGQNRRPDLRSLYDRAAQTHGPSRNPIIAIPGIMGSKLAEESSGRLVWGAFGGGAASPKKPEGARLLALPMREQAPLSELTDSVYSNGALDRVKVRLFGLPIVLKAYLNVMKTLGTGGYRDEDVSFSGIDYGDDHFTCFQFDYDWRRDVSENAARLHRFILEKQAYVAGEYKRRFGIDEPKIRFDIAAHSMGGLLARYYLRFGAEPLPEDGSVPKPTWAGAEFVERVVMVGTPNGGSLKALQNLVDGLKVGPMLPRYPPALVGTMPAVYQLLPRDRHGLVVDATAPDRRVGSLYDPELWKRLGWGLTDPRQDEMLARLLPDVTDAESRRRIAFDHLRKSLARARQFTQAMDQPSKPPAHLTLKLVAGDAVPTASRASVDPATGKLAIIEHGPGDGTVLRTSALLDERTGGTWQRSLVTPIVWSDVDFLFRDHLGMTKDPHFTDNVLFFLLEERGIGASSP